MENYNLIAPEKLGEGSSIKLDVSIAEVDIYAFNAVKTVEDSIVIKKTENKEDGTSIILVLILLIVIVIIGYVFIRRKFIRPKRRPANKQRKKVVAYDELGRIK